MGHYTTPTFLATFQVSSQISSSTNCNTCDVPCWLSKAFLWKSQTQNKRQGETSCTKTWQMKTAKIILWSSIRLWPDCFLNRCQQSTCWNKDTHVKSKKERKKNQKSMTLHFMPFSITLHKLLHFCVTRSQNPWCFVCFAGHGFPWLSPLGQTKTGEPALWKILSPEHLQDLNSPKLLLYISVLCTWGLLWIQTYSTSSLTIWTSGFSWYQTGFSTLLKM